MKKRLQHSLLAMTLLGLASFSSTLTAAPIPAESRIGPFAMGCQAYSFNHYSVFEAIEKTAEVGGKVIEFYPGQKLSVEEPDVKWDHNASDEVIQKVKDKLAKHGIRAVNYGVVGIPKDEAGARKVFDFAKKLGLYGVTTESTESIDTIDKLVKEYDIRVGYHNHPRQPNNPNYKVWDPNYILALVKDHDSRIGSCADCGHWVRSGLKPVECLKILEGRIISSHLKDLHKLGPETRGNPLHDVPYGEGVSDIAGILTELKRQNFQGNISVEYEYNWTTSVPEIAQCVGFVRGFAAGMK